MRFAVALSALLTLAGCDAAGAGLEPLEAPGPDAYTLAVEVDESGVLVRAAGRARYTLTDLPRGPGARVASVALVPNGPRVEGRIGIYVSQDGQTPFPQPGTYSAGRFGGAPFAVTFEIDGRTFSAYRGTITVEAASDAEIVARLDVGITTGGCALLPRDVCSGPTRTGVLRARLRARAAADREPLP